MKIRVMAVQSGVSGVRSGVLIYLSGSNKSRLEVMIVINRQEAIRRLEAVRRSLRYRKPLKKNGSRTLR